MFAKGGLVVNLRQRPAFAIVGASILAAAVVVVTVRPFRVFGQGSIGNAGPTVLATQGPISVQSFTPTSAVNIPNLAKPSNTATLYDGNLSVNGVSVAAGVGPAVWSSDGTTLFYAPAPPLQNATQAEPVYALTPGGSPTQIGVAQDPWRIAPIGATNVAFNSGGTLAIASPSGKVTQTSISLATSAAYPFTDSAFAPSPDGIHVAVVAPDNTLTMYTLSPSGQVTSTSTLPGTVPANRTDWGVWNQGGTYFLYSTRNPQSPSVGIYAWSAATENVTTVYASSNSANTPNQLFVLGFLNPLPGDVVVEEMSGGTTMAGTYEVINLNGTIVEKLWQGGYAGVVLPNGSVQFSMESPGQAPVSEQANLGFSNGG
jgi:hypothetical protein